MTPGELAAFALEKADLRNARRQVRLFHPVAYEEADQEFVAAVTAAAATMTAEAAETVVTATTSRKRS